MNRAGIDRAIQAFAFPAAVYLCGAAWSIVDIFVLGHWEPKFGRGGTLTAALMVLGLIAGIAVPMSYVVRLVLRRRLVGCTLARHLIVASVAAAASISMLLAESLGPPAKRISDALGGGPTIAFAVMAVLMAVLYGLTIMLTPPVRRSG